MQGGRTGNHREACGHLLPEPWRSAGIRTRQERLGKGMQEEGRAGMRMQAGVGVEEEGQVDAPLHAREGPTKQNLSKGQHESVYRTVRG